MLKVEGLGYRAQALGARVSRHEALDFRFMSFASKVDGVKV